MSSEGEVAGPARETEPVSGGPRACPVCSGTDARLCYRGRGGEDGRAYAFLRCRDCGLIFLEGPRGAEALSDSYGDDYYGAGSRKFGPLTDLAIRYFGFRRRLLVEACLPPRGAVLDVGCGRGDLIAGLARRGYRCVGTERTAATAAWAREISGLSIHAGAVEDLDAEEGSFDAAVLWHVLEHISDPASALVRIRSLLRHRGKIVVAVPNVASFQARLFRGVWFHLDPPRHVIHFSPRTLRRLLHRTGFEVSAIHHLSLEQNPFGLLQSLLNALGFERDSLYAVLKQNPKLVRERYSPLHRALLLAVYLLGMPGAIMLSTIGSLLRRGATIHVLGQRR